MYKKIILLFLILCVYVLLLYLNFYPSEKNNITNEEKEKKNESLGSQLITLKEFIEKIIKEKGNITELNVTIKKGDYLNVSDLLLKGLVLKSMKEKLVFIFWMILFTILIQIIFKKSYNGKLYIGCYFEKDENAT